MSASKKLTAAEQSRFEYQQLRAHAPKAPPLAPTPHADNPLLPDVAGDLPNQLHFSLQGAEFKLRIPRWAAAGDTSGLVGDVTLVYDGTAETTFPPAKYDFVTPLDPLILFIELTLPAGRTVEEGPHEISYIVNQGNTEDSDPLIINIDRTPPITGGVVILPAEVEADGITKTYLDNNGGRIALRIPNYSVAATGDVVDFHYGDGFPATLIGSFTRPDITTPVTVDLTTAQVGLVEGEKAIYYFISDRKGNVSAISAVKFVQVTLTDPPIGLLAPNIPLYSDSLIDLADAQTPVGVGILAQYTNFLDGDNLVVTWDGLLQTALPISSFPVYFDVPFPTVFNGNAGIKDVTVSYQIKRGVKLHDSPPSVVSVDLRKPGPVIDPNNPGPPNPALVEADLQGTGGNAVNVLTEADAGALVTVRVPIFLDGKADDSVQLRYNGVEVQDADGGVVTLVGAGPYPNPLIFSVRWDVFNAQGNGNPIPLDYIIRHPLNNNVDISPVRGIDAYITPEVVPDPTFINLRAGLPPNFMNCTSLRHHTLMGTVAHVSIGPEPRLAGTTMNFAYQGYTTELGTDTIPGTAHIFDYSPSLAEATAGFIVNVPYAPLLASSDRWGGIKYIAYLGGKFINSKQHIVRTYLVLPGGGPCPIPTNV